MPFKKMDCSVSALADVLVANASRLQPHLPTLIFTEFQQTWVIPRQAHAQRTRCKLGKQRRSRLLWLAGKLTYDKLLSIPALKLRRICDKPSSPAKLLRHLLPFRKVTCLQRRRTFWAKRASFPEAPSGHRSPWCFGTKPDVSVFGVFEIKI